VPTLRFTLPRQQQSTPLIAAACFLAVAGIVAAFGGLGFAIPLALLAVMLLVVWGLVMYGSYGILDESGIRSRRGVFRHHVAWHNVREVKLDPKSGECLVVYRHHGRAFKLGAPVSGGLSTDPQYRAKVAQVLQYVAARTAEPGVAG
jgi:hypothetical protein